MKIILRIAVCVLVLALPLTASVASTADSDLSVGEFAVRLAGMITQKSDIQPLEAVEFLGKLGVTLDGTLEQSVTEEMMVEAFDELGLRLTTSSPGDAVDSNRADRLFQLFDANDSLFTGELFNLCKGGAVNQNCPCVTDADCDGGFCQTLSSINCQGGANAGQACMSDADCPMGTCNIPPGQAKKLNLASPDD